MKLKRFICLLLAGAIVTGNISTLVPNNTVVAASKKKYKTSGRSYVTWANELRESTTPATGWQTVKGFFSINNNNQGVDYKVSEDAFKNTASSIISNSERDIYAREKPTRNMEDLSTEKSWLIENQVISRRLALTYSGSSGLRSVLRTTNDDGKKINDARDRMDKTELLTALYKAIYGVLDSRPVVWNTRAFRSNNGTLTAISKKQNYLTTENKSINAIFDSDYNIYFHPDVYELYLTALLNKGIIKLDDFSKKKSNFIESYKELQSTDNKPAWYASLKPVILDDTASMLDGSTDFLGESVSISNTAGNSLNKNVGVKAATNVPDNSGVIILDTKQPDYFKNENLTTIDALKLIEIFLRLSEKDMTDTEARTVSYKYDIQYLNGLDSDTRKTIAFLTAKGILNFEDEEEYVELYDDFTYETAYKLLYRVANKDARFDFSKIQLTDNEKFWQEQGYASDTVNVVDGDDFPYMRTLEDDETFESLGDFFKRTTSTKDVGEESETQSEVMPETQVPDVKDATNTLLYVLCTDKETAEPLANVAVTVYNSAKEILETGYSDGSGIVAFNLNYGTYYFNETEAPDGYVANSTLNSVVLNAEHSQRKFQIATSKSVNGRLKILAAEEGSDVPVYGTQFEIYDKTGNLITTIDFSESTSPITLDYGNYTIKVTSVPDGYQLDGSEQLKTIRLSKYNSTIDVKFAIKLKASILESTAKKLSNMLKPITVYAKSSNYEIRMLLEKKEGYTYTYGNTEITSNTKKSDNDDFKSDVETKSYSNGTMYLLTFQVEASNRNTALSVINSKLKVTGINKESSMVGVTEMSNDTGDAITLVSSSDIKSGLPDIKVINNNTLMNTKTGTTAVLLPTQGYALVGNNVIVSDDLVVIANDKEVYYNLKVIAALMSNAMIKKINGATTLVSKTLKKEKLYEVYSENNTKLESVYTAKFDGIVEKYKDETGEKKRTPVFYNLSSMSRGISCISRTFNKRVTNKNSKNSNTSITVIVQWDFVVPDVDSELSDSLAGLSGSDALDFQKASDLLNTEPANKTLKDWWNYNLDMSNALANFIYGTANVQYVTCGYMVPSVTILSSAGGSRSSAVNVTSSNSNVVCDANSLSDTQLNNLFEGLSLPSSYVKRYLGGTKNNWWTSYYNVDKYDNSTIRNLMSKAGFSNYAGNELYYAEKTNSSITDGFVYGNAKYVVLNNGTIYANALADNRFTVDQSGKKISLATSTNGKTQNIVAKGTKVTVSNAGDSVVFEYQATETIADQTYYKLSLVSTDEDTPAFFTGYLKANNCKTVDKLKKAAKDPGNYVSTLDETLYDYEKRLYRYFGLTELPFASLNIARRFSLNQNDLSLFMPNFTYLDFYTDGAANVRFFEYKDDALKPIDITAMASEDGNEYTVNRILNANVYVYVPTSNFYFSTNSDGETVINQGSDLGVLNSRIYYTGLNNCLRDSLIAEAGGTIPVNKIAAGAQVYVGDLLFTMQADGSLLAGPIEAKDDIMLGILSSIDTNNTDALKSYLLKTFGTQSVVVGNRNVSLQSFLTDAFVGNKIETKLKKVLFRQNGEYYYSKNAKEDIVYQKNSSPNLQFYNLAIKVDNNLLCRPLDSGNTLYQMLYSSDAYATGLSKLPFYPEYLGSDKNNSVNAYWKVTQYTIHQYADTLKSDFLDTYKKAFQGDLFSLFKWIIANVLLYLMGITFICLFFLKTRIGRQIFQTIAMPSGGRRNGFDLIQIISLNLFHYDDDPSLWRVLVMEFAFYCIMYLVLDVI